MMKKYLRNLRDLVLEKMGEGNYTIMEFSVKCDVSYQELCNIKNGKSHNPMFETVVKICENAGISYADVFDCHEEFNEKSTQEIVSRFHLTDGDQKYKLVLQK